MKRPIVGLVALAALASAAAVSVPAATGSSNGIVASVDGSGHVTAPFPGTGLRTFSFAARAYADGSVKGEAELVLHWVASRYHMALDCLDVSGSEAFAGGMVTSSSNPAVVGLSALFFVRDNGEGVEASPDQISLLSVGLAGTCHDAASQAEVLSYGVLEIEEGNVQVR